MKMRAPRALRRDSNGIAAVEFAFVAPVFLFLTTAAIDLGYIQWGRSQLAGATQVAGRAIIQSKNPNGTSRTTAARKTTFTNTITAAMASFRKPAGQNIAVTVRKYSNFSKMAPEPFVDGSNDPAGNGRTNIVASERNGRYDTGEDFTDSNGNSQWDQDPGTSDDLGGIGDVIKAEVTYPMKPLFSYNAALLGVNGSILISASTVFRNEPE